MITDSGTAATLDGVVKRYGSTTALDGVGLRIERGRVTALLGANGAGKSTSVAVLLGLTRPDAGSVSLLGSSPQLLATRRRIGVMLQSAALPDTLRVRELLRLTASYYPNPKPIAEVVRSGGIGELLGRLYGKLSGGQQRRVQFALAVCGRPELLFLDEPTTGLDIEAREMVWSVIRALVAQGCAVLLTTHYLEEAEALAHRVAVLVRGRIVADGTLDEVRAQGVRRRISCITRVPPEHTRSWPGVSAARRQQERLEIEATVAEPVVRRLLDLDPDLSGLEVRRAGLAEAFIQLTREVA
ncbi:MAG TPA: ABC transporter ATP-binding protein [Steroidobacteraceae bacterium]|nr:ABC transporter ATP-binding protein [Steroidobacteraceae bacterium]